VSTEMVQLSLPKDLLQQGVCIWRERQRLNRLEEEGPPGDIADLWESADDETAEFLYRVCEYVEAEGVLRG
jgi:hypothetical protein